MPLDGACHVMFSYEVRLPPPTTGDFSLPGSGAQSIFLHRTVLDFRGFTSVFRRRGLLVFPYLSLKQDYVQHDTAIAKTKDGGPCTSCISEPNQNPEPDENFSAQVQTPPLRKVVQHRLYVLLPCEMGRVGSGPTCNVEVYQYQDVARFYVRWVL